MDVYELIKDLTQCVGASGVEKGVVNKIREYVKPFGDVRTDKMNNVYCTFGEGYHFLFDAHTDEVGFMITDITDEGFIKFDKCGGLDTRILPGHEVSLWGKKEIKGIIQVKPPHLMTDEDKKKAPKISDMAIDTGCSCETVHKYLRIGDRGTLKRNYLKLLGDKISATSLDDRAGVAALILAAEKLKDVNCKVTLMFSAQEEVGTRGAKAGAFGIEPDEAICVDVSFAYSPGCYKSECGELAKGAMIGFSPTLDKEMSQKLVNVAEKNKIAFQTEIMSERTGTNADVISVTQTGIKTGLISIPIKNMHQAVEVADIKDIQAVADLIVAYVKERVGEINA